MPRQKLTDYHKQNKLKNVAEHELREKGYKFGWLTPITSATKITDYESGSKGKYYRFFRHKTKNTRVALIGDTYYYLQGD